MPVPCGALNASFLYINFSINTEYGALDKVRYKSMKRAIRRNQMSSYTMSPCLSSIFNQMLLSNGLCACVPTSSVKVSWNGVDCFISGGW